ncbi:hypothetical protein B5S30_g1907 [[Candida] boidinii]|nr:hypothetical protein B5S30_g1907 [[Candida] boidinii]
MVSEFERQRLLNISRNKELFKKLNLDSISTNFKNEISRDLPSSNNDRSGNGSGSHGDYDTSKRSSKRAKTTARRVKVKNELDAKSKMPLRRSSRIAGVKIESPVGVDGSEVATGYFHNNLEEVRRLEELKRMRLSGDVSLMDILNSGQSKPVTANNSRSNSRVNSPLSSPRKRRTRNSSAEDDEVVVKTEEGGDASTSELTDTPLNSDEISKLQEISKLGKSLSMGDFYEIIKSNKNLSKNNDKNGDNKLDDLRNELDELKLYSKTHPNNINLTTARMTAILFHPSNTKKIIIGGDRDGETGIWSVDDTVDNDDDDDGLGYNDSDPVITQIKTHGKNIPKFEIRENKLEEIMSCSYDGSIRALDLNKLISKSVLEFDDEYGNVSGISDFQFVDNNVLYFTTLNGEFGSLDTREKNNGRRRLNVLRLHDKKIGSFSINPKFDKQIVTASLDRTMRVWDLRKTQKSNWSVKFSDEMSPHCIGSYSSRLSVSTADWNNSGDIVCNGYDDTINIFNLSKFGLESQRPTYQFPITHSDKQYDDDDLDEQEQMYNKLIPDNLEPDSKIRHNCQTGRWVSILKAKWQKNPNDGIEKFVIGNMKRFFDIYDRNGNLLGHLSDSLMTSVPAVCNFHSTENWLVGGNASGKVFLFHNE